MFKKVRYLLKTIFSKRTETQENINNDLAIKSIISLILMVSAAVLTVLNTVNKYTDMMYSTIALFAAFAIAFVLLKFFKVRKFTQILMGLTIMGIFSYYAISGQNHGFAILWIALVPAVSMLLLSFRLGLIISIYFAVFLIVIFYTPLNGWLNENIQILQDNEPGVFTMVHSFRDNYTSTFKIRFPLLYLCGFFTSLLLTGQKEYYLIKSEKNALYDALTGLKNRRFFIDYIDAQGANTVAKDFTVVSLDLNGLKVFNDKYGHDVGDRCIKAGADLLHEVFDPYTEYIFRTGGDEYFVFLYDPNNEVNSLLEKIEARENEIIIEDGNCLSMSFGAVKGIEYIDKNLNELLTVAESLMYKYKDEYYKQSNIDRRYDARKRI